jgi:lipopolysaccharide/colanic/teichoic acid biosynthesis glycosyltransferase
MILKRIFDVVFSGIGLVLLAPLMVLIAALVRITMGPPVLFRQIRPGLNGLPFILLKFRTMRGGPSGESAVETDARRMIPLGNFLRKCSLDELPELWNVFCGEMSLVGPRPLLMEYLEKYSPEQKRRMEVKPGLTGWAQIKGRNSLSWQEKFALDVWYVDHQNFWLDLWILLVTLPVVFGRRGVSAPGEATAKVFSGQRCGTKLSL